MTNKCYNLIGLATKAGKTVTGTELCEIAIKKRQAKLVIISKEASKRTQDDLTDCLKYYNTKYRIFGTKELLGKYTGKVERTAIAILDEQFARKIVEYIDEEGGEADGEKNQSI